jgi:predicted ATP-dependent Lon-type protease
MDIVQKLKLVVRENDFVEVGKSEAGTTSWFRKVSSNMRLCIDDLTNSATVFWEAGAAQLGSKTFRTATSLREWFALQVERCRPQARRRRRLP